MRRRILWALAALMVLPATLAGQVIQANGTCVQREVDRDGYIRERLVACYETRFLLNRGQGREGLEIAAKEWYAVCREGVAVEVKPAKRVLGVLVRGPEEEWRFCGDTLLAHLDQLSGPGSVFLYPASADSAVADDLLTLQTVVTAAWFRLTRPEGWEAQLDSVMTVRPRGAPCGVYPAPCPPRGVRPPGARP